jgi:2-polyprenyl-3-methyl-5-hydroxy-6-metoxy-1,4-benzoquinol methylase
MKAFNWLKETYTEFADGRSVPELFRSGVDSVKSNLRTYLFKAQHLKETNRDLAFYHYDRGNINDAIMRFKLLQHIDSRPEYEYYLGRLYLEKGKDLEAEKHLKNYLAGSHKELKQEASFCLALATDNYESINCIPESLIKHTGVELAHIYSSKFSKQPEALLISKLFQAFEPIVRDKFGIDYLKILDIGCADGVLGYFCRYNFAVEKLIGVEFVAELATIALSRKLNNGHVYNKVLNQDFWKTSSDLGGKFSLVLADDWISYYPDLNKFLPIIKNLLEQNGLCVVTFSINNNIGEYKFSKANEQFEFNLEYVEHCISKGGLKVVFKQVIKYSAAVESFMVILEK